MAAAALAALATPVKSQSVAEPQISSNSAVLSFPAATRPALDLTYHRPSEKTKLRNYLF
jgi:hypothetical protein